MQIEFTELTDRKQICAVPTLSTPKDWLTTLLLLGPGLAEVCPGHGSAFYPQPSTETVFGSRVRLSSGPDDVQQSQVCSQVFVQI